MPLPNDEKLLALSEDLLHQFDAIFGLHPGFRPAHAKGILLKGVFQPTKLAASLSRAAHFNSQSTPVLVRFSNSTGVPMIPDNDPNADPRGMAVRFLLGEHKHTDIVCHSTDGFPTRTGQEFLEFLRALASSDPAHLEGTPLAAFLASHPAALRYVQTPKPAPTSFARNTYFGVTAMHFVNGAGEGQFGRYRIVPDGGNEFVDANLLKNVSTDYLLEEIRERVSKAPVRFKLMLQLASSGDVVDNATVQWPEARQIVSLGSLNITEIAAENQAEQKTIIFDPIPRIDGIEPSADPLLELRAAIYLISGRRRRSA